MSQRKWLRLATCFLVLASSIGLGMTTVTAVAAHAVLCSVPGGTSDGAAGAAVEAGPGGSVAVCDPTTGDVRLSGAASGSGATVNEASCYKQTSTCTSTNVAQVSNGSDAGGLVAVSKGGNAQGGWCSAFGPVPWCELGGVAAVSTGGSANGLVAVDPTGAATGGVAVSGTGTAAANGVAISGTGYSYGDRQDGGEDLAFSGTGDSNAWASVSGTTGVGMPVYVSGQLLASVPALLKTLPPPVSLGCPPVKIDLTQTPPVYRTTCALGEDPPSTPTCNGCTAYNGLEWTTNGKTENMAVFDRKNTADEAIYQQNVHGTLIQSAHGTSCEAGTTRYEGNQLWSDNNDAGFTTNSPELASGYYSGHRNTWVGAGGSSWDNDGAHWDAGEDGGLDLCKAF